MTRTSCEDCRSTYDGYDENPPCGIEPHLDLNKCEWYKVRLFPSNEIIWNVYRRVILQKIDGQVFNILAVYETMDRLSVPRDEQLEMTDVIFLIDQKIIELIGAK